MEPGIDILTSSLHVMRTPKIACLGSYNGALPEKISLDLMDMMLMEVKRWIYVREGQCGTENSYPSTTLYIFVSIEHH